MCYLTEINEAIFFKMDVFYVIFVLVEMTERSS